MGQRDVKQIDESLKSKVEPTAETEAPASIELKANISMNYPQPVALDVVLGEVAKWSVYSIVMEPKLNRPIQIFASHLMNADDAFNLLVASLETIGLRAIRLKGDVIKIVLAKVGSIAV